MDGFSKKQTAARRQKQKIRQRYQGSDLKNLEVIPVTVLQPDLYDDDEPKRVAVYARVSTDDPRQTSSYELQKNYFERQIEKHPNWTLAAIYADEGRSGTSMEKREEFNRMIEDCKAGKIDMILTKSVSRFARNYVDCGLVVRELLALRPPVGVYFESDDLFTPNMGSEMRLSLSATMAQEESRIKSSAMNASIEMRFSNGIFLTPPLLGYDQDEDGNLTINEDEAKIVRLIFFLYLYGYSCRQIADALANLGCRTKKGSAVWSEGGVLQILQNERHCGAVKARKTFTPSYLDHKSRKNRGDRPQYVQREHHDPIISPEDYLAVQKLISNAKYGGRGILPVLHTVPAGALQGFVVVNPRWAGFTAGDYIDASARVEAVERVPEHILFEAQPGDLDFRGFEIVRAQLFQTAVKLSVTFSIENLRFSMACIRKFQAVPQVELLVHPGERLMAVRPAQDNLRHAIRWTKAGCPRAVGGAAFLPTLYRLFHWNMEYRYRVQGVFRQKGNEAVLLFDLYSAEALIPSKYLEEVGIHPAAPRRAAVAFPPAWMERFGDNPYIHSWARELAAVDRANLWQIMCPAAPPDGASERVFFSSPSIKSNIRKLEREVRRERLFNGE